MSIAITASLLLAVITAGMAWLVRIVWKRTGDPSVPIGAALIYLWTFSGAWFFIADASTGFNGYRIGLGYYYLMEKMFPFELNRAYIASLAGYAAFSLVLLAVLLPIRARRCQTDPAVPLRTPLLALAGLGAMVLMLLLSIAPAEAAIAQERPLYLVMHEWSGAWRTAHAHAARAACIAFVLGTAVQLGDGRPGAPFRAVAGRWGRAACPAGMLLMAVVLAFLGDRHSLFMALVLGTVYVASCAGAGTWRRVALLLGGGCAALLLAGWVRGLTWSAEGLKATAPDTSPFVVGAIAHVPREPQGTVQRVGRQVLSNELFCAHFSLFGTLERQVAHAPGISFRHLAGSFVAREHRPPDVYTHYATQARLRPGQGYTIHAATGWYLNAGPAGIVLGGLVLGGLWALALRAAQWGSALAWPRLLPWMFVSFLPAMVRSGPESLKALLIEGLLLPLLVVVPAWWASVRYDGTERTDHA